MTIGKARSEIALGSAFFGLEQLPRSEVRFLLFIGITGATIMRITSKGQVTIPQDIRERAGLMPGTEVEFVFERGKVSLKAITKTKSRARLAIEQARGTANEPMFRGWTTDQIMAFLRGED